MATSVPAALTKLVTFSTRRGSHPGPTTTTRVISRVARVRPIDDQQANGRGTQGCRFAARGVLVRFGREPNNGRRLSTQPPTGRHTYGLGGTR